jgi:hypothetical protein
MPSDATSNCLLHFFLRSNEKAKAALPHGG